MSLVETTDKQSASKEVAKIDMETAPLGVQLKHRTKQFEGSLPAHMPVERYMRVVMLAVQQQPALWKADRRSFWNACLKAASDGLLPDGREGALVVYNTNTKVEGQWRSVPTVAWQPMVAGIRKKARNSGLIATWDVQAVYQRDQFEFELGDDPFIRHRPYMPTSLERKKDENDEDFAMRWRTHCNPGPLIAAYSVCLLKSGEKSRDVMTRQEIEYVRDVYSKRDSKGNFTPAWVKSFGEMAKKTVAKRHSKVLPMSTDLDDLMRRDDELYDLKGASDKQIDKAKQPKELADRMEAVLAGVLPEDEPPGNGGGGGGPPMDVDTVDPDTGEITPAKTKQADPVVTSGKQETAEASTPSAGKEGAGQGAPPKGDPAPSDAGKAAPADQTPEQARKRGEEIRAEIDKRKAELVAAEKKASGEPAKQAAPAKPSGGLTAQELAILDDLVETGAARAESGERALRQYLDEDVTATERKLIPPAVVTGWIKTAKAVDAAKGAQG